MLRNAKASNTGESFLREKETRRSFGFVNKILKQFMESGKDVGRFSRHHGQIVSDLVAVRAVDKGHADHTFGIVGMEFLESAKGE